MTAEGTKKTLHKKKCVASLSNIRYSAGNDDVPVTSRRTMRKTLSRMSAFLFGTADQKQPRRHSRPLSILDSLDEGITAMIKKLEEAPSELTDGVDQLYTGEGVAEEENVGDSTCVALLRELENNNIYLFDEVNNITSALSHSGDRAIVFVRILCNGMEPTHHWLLRTLAKRLGAIQTTVVYSAFVSRLAPVESVDRLVPLRCFMETITTEWDKVFSVCD